jgi:hypothetical protein
MRKWILPSVAVIAMVIAACISGPVPKETRAWIEMCDVVSENTEYSCGGVTPPKVVYENMRPGLYGYYDGSDTVYVNSALGDHDTLATIIHEMIHYLHVQNKQIPIPGPAKLICWSENEAWTLEGLWSGTDNSYWWVAYPHCWRYYDPQFQNYHPIFIAIYDSYYPETK